MAESLFEINLLWKINHPLLDSNICVIYIYIYIYTYIYIYIYIYMYMEVRGS